MAKIPSSSRYESDISPPRRSATTSHPPPIDRTRRTTSVRGQGLSPGLVAFGWIAALILLAMVVGGFWSGSSSTEKANDALEAGVVRTFQQSKSFTASPGEGASYVNVRAGAGRSYAAIARLSPGDAVAATGEILGDDGSVWVVISLADDSVGYVKGTLVQ